jgi:hypothetical protein
MGRTVRAVVAVALMFLMAVILSKRLPAPAANGAAIIDTLKAYRLVAIGEAHRSQRLHDFIVRLLQTRAFCQAAGISWSSSAMRGTLVPLITCASWFAGTESRVGELARTPASQHGVPSGQNVTSPCE